MFTYQNLPYRALDGNLPYAPRNITHAKARLLQIAANGCLMGCCEMLKRFGFRLEMLYLCTSEEERALNMRVFFSFFAKKWDFHLRDSFFYITENFFSWSLRIFSP